MNLASGLSCVNKQHRNIEAIHPVLNSTTRRLSHHTLGANTLHLRRIDRRFAHDVAILRRASKPRLRPVLRPKPPILPVQLRRSARLGPRHTRTSLLRLRRALLVSNGLWLARIRLQLRRAAGSSIRRIRPHGRAGRLKDRLASSSQHRGIRRGATPARRAGRRLQSRQSQGTVVLSWLHPASLTTARHLQSLTPSPASIST